MSKQVTRRLGVVIGVAVAVAVVTGCSRKPQAESAESADSPGMAERTGAALDQAADRTADAMEATGKAAKDLTGRAIERTGEVMEKVGESLEQTGAAMKAESVGPTDE